MGKKIVKPATKVGGVRRSVKSRPPPQPVSYYKDNKNLGVFPRKLSNYRIVICTDMNASDMLFLTLFTAWIKANEKQYDSHQTFPIYGFIINGTRVKTQRVREFLKAFGELLKWDDPEHHLYKGYSNSGFNIWINDRNTSCFNNEQELVFNKEALQDDNYPDAQNLCEGISSIMSNKPNNLFFVYLNNPTFLSEYPDFSEYLKNVAGVLYNDDFSIDNKFLNRSNGDAPLVYLNPESIGENDINLNNCSKVFELFDDADENSYCANLKKTMLTCNDSFLEKCKTYMKNLPEFANVDFENLNSINNVYTDKNKKIVNTVLKIVKTQSQYLELQGFMTMMALLTGNGSLNNTLFTLKGCTISNNIVNLEKTAKTFYLQRNNDSEYAKNIRKLFIAFFKSAITIVDE